MVEHGPCRKAQEAPKSGNSSLPEETAGKLDLVDGEAIKPLHAFQNDICPARSAVWTAE